MIVCARITRILKGGFKAALHRNEYIHRYFTDIPFKTVVSELKHYRLCGVILLLMNVALSGVVVLVIRKNEGFHYAGYLIYVVAMYAFYNIISAVRDVLKYRKYKSPVMSAAKAIKLASVRL